MVIIKMTDERRFNELVFGLLTVFPNESLHAQTELSPGTGIILVPGFLRQTTTFLLQQQPGENNFLPCVWLRLCAAEPWANSSSDRSRWTSRPPKPFSTSLTPLLTLYTTAKLRLGSCGYPTLPIQCIFSRDSFLSASKVSLSGSPRPPADQMLGRLRISAGSLSCADLKGSSANKVQVHHLPRLV
ncbi:hypothetical protein Q8A73_005475 [Channa argus]|nr:hypothetical protein Q8A73_005475 [Channa argus]